MIELKVMGSVRMTGSSDAGIEAVLVQPKRLALLSYLALSPEPLVPRDRLLALLWPESDERRAREALRQALRFLRRSLGSDLLVTQGRNWVGVSRAHVDCDIWRFYALLEAGDLSGALSLYNGELLEGLEVRAAPGFEQWLSVSRQEVARRAADACWQLAELARDEGDAVAAQGHAWRAREILPADEEGLRRLMGLLLWSGDRAGALRAYESFETWLAKEFEAVPSVRTRELADRARGPALAGSDAANAANAVDAAVDEASAERSGPDATAAMAEPDAERVPEPNDRRETGVGVRRLTGWRILPGWPNCRCNSSAPRTAVAAMVLVVGLLALGFSYLGLLPSQRGLLAEGTDGPDLLLVAPFNVSQADISLSFLRHGMVDLLGAVFTGEVGPAAVAARRSRLSRFAIGGGSDVASRARRTGARWIIHGEVMGNDRDVRLSGTIRDLHGLNPPRTAAVSGSADDVYGLARQLACRLLAMSLGARKDEAERLGATTPAALHAYLLGRQALNQTRYEEADRRFHAALRHDPAFAAAAFGLVETHLSAPWVRGHVSELALPLAFRLLDQLGPAEREFVLAAAGPRHPERSSHLEYYHAWERAVAKAPDRAPVWYQWGDAIFHTGPLIGLPSHRERSAAAFEHALALDPDYLVPLTHLIELATESGDSERAAALLDRLLAGSQDGEPVNADYLRWRVALAANDEPALEELRARFPEMTVGSLGAIVRSAAFLGQGLDDADRIAALDLSRWNAPAERWNLLVRFQIHALNRGRRSEARLLAEAMRDVAPTAYLHTHIRSALGAGGDPAAAREAATQLEARVGLLDVTEQTERRGLISDVCALEVWKLYHDDTSTVRQTIQWLRDPGYPAPDQVHRQSCATFLDAMLTRRQRPHLLPRAIAQVQVLADEGVHLPGVGFEPIWLFLTMALEETGNIEAALEVIRRRSSNPFTLPTQLRIEGRLAAMIGDTVAARHAYAHYLALRENPEPALMGELLEVRHAYEALGG